MEKVLVKKVVGLPQIADAINVLCEDERCGFDAEIVSDIWGAGPNRAGKVSARVHKPTFGEPFLVLRVEHHATEYLLNRAQNDILLFSHSKEVSMTPSFILFDESAEGQPRIDFFGMDMNDLPHDIRDLIRKHENIGIHHPERQKEIQNAVDRLIPKMYASITRSS